MQIFSETQPRIVRASERASEISLRARGDKTESIQIGYFVKKRSAGNESVTRTNKLSNVLFIQDDANGFEII